ncbi:hypothetical protein KL86APRO_20259 [uncultured Alphaproteobacteria bacterium]|uniref:Uncharacterized protein n=1 Tax=uncultured Alphaproteobacteria bacterium TaxID=91750 RepID=A0A212KJ97_9PROT|nr:hypothetical protein KL86APRO_20259 [uncultured Alphaproteobacteria bacterium]
MKDLFDKLLKLWMGIHVDLPGYGLDRAMVPVRVPVRSRPQRRDF